MSNQLLRLLARFIASEPSRTGEFVTWFTGNGHLGNDTRAFLVMLRDECEQSLTEIQEADLTAFEEIAAAAWNKEAQS